MEKGFFGDAPPFAKLIFVIGITAIIFLSVSVTGMVVGALLFDISIQEIFTSLPDTSNQSNVLLLKFLQIIQSAGLFLIPPFIIGWFFSRNSYSYLTLNKKISLYSGLLVVLVMLTSFPVINFLAEMNAGIELPEQLSQLERWMKKAEENAKEITEIFLSNNSGIHFLINFLMIAIIPAIGEELLFRGVFQRIFVNWTQNKHIGILIAGVLFSAFHFQFYGFIPRLLLGVFFGYLFVWSGSIWLPVLAHFVNNAAAVIVYNIFSIEEVNNTIDKVGATQNTYYMALISAAILTGLIWLLHKHESESTNTG
jgi:hypothetical protein